MKQIKNDKNDWYHLTKEASVVLKCRPQIGYKLRQDLMHNYNSSAANFSIQTLLSREMYKKSLEDSNDENLEQWTCKP